MEELPCPQRIPFDSGVGFSIGTTLGTLWNSVKGYRENPSARWEGVKRAVRTNAPRLGGKRQTFLSLRSDQGEEREIAFSSQSPSHSPI